MLRVLYGFFYVLMLLYFVSYELLKYFIDFVVERAILKVEVIYSLWQELSSRSIWTPK